MNEASLNRITRQINICINTNGNMLFNYECNELMNEYFSKGSRPRPTLAYEIKVQKQSINPKHHSVAQQELFFTAIPHIICCHSEQKKESNAYHTCILSSGYSERSVP